MNSKTQDERGDKEGEGEGDEAKEKGKQGDTALMRVYNVGKNTHTLIVK